LHTIVKLDLGRIENGVLALGLKVFLAGPDFKDVDAIQSESMHPANCEQFIARLGKRDIESFLAAANSFLDKLKGKGGLAGAGFAFDEIRMAGGESPAQHVVQAYTS
jgi:hypothetical protein